MTEPLEPLEVMTLNEAIQVLCRDTGMTPEQIVGPSLPQCPNHPGTYVAKAGECPQCGWMPGSDGQPVTLDLGYLRKVYETIDDLWACIGPDEIADLQDITVAVAQRVHVVLCHLNEPAQEESHQLP